MSAVVEFAAGVASFPCLYGSYRAATKLTIWPKKKKSKFDPRAGVYFDRDKQEGILVWITATGSYRDFPSRAKDLIEWHGDSNKRGINDYKIIGFVRNDDPDAEDKLVDLVVTAKSLSEDWEEKHLPETRDLLGLAERALSR